MPIQACGLFIVFVLPAEYWPSCWQEPLLVAYSCRDVELRGRDSVLSLCDHWHTNVRATAAKSQPCNGRNTHHQPSGFKRQTLPPGIWNMFMPSTATRSLLSFKCVFFFFYVVCLCISSEVNESSIRNAMSVMYRCTYYISYSLCLL